MRGIGAGQRIFELLGRSPAIPPASGVPVAVPSVQAGTTAGTVRFERVAFEYPSRPGVEVLKDFTLDVKRGESVALV